MRVSERCKNRAATEENDGNSEMMFVFSVLVILYLVQVKCYHTLSVKNFDAQILPFRPCRLGNFDII